MTMWKYFILFSFINCFFSKQLYTKVKVVNDAPDSVYSNIEKKFLSAIKNDESVHHSVDSSGEISEKTFTILDKGDKNCPLDSKFCFKIKNSTDLKNILLAFNENNCDDVLDANISISLKRIEDENKTTIVIDRCEVVHKYAAVDVKLNMAQIFSNLTNATYILSMTYSGKGKFLRRKNLILSEYMEMQHYYIISLKIKNSIFSKVRAEEEKSNYLLPEYVDNYVPESGCDPITECCRMDVVISLQKLKFHRLIFSPNSFIYSMCYGNCSIEILEFYKNVDSEYDDDDLINIDSNNTRNISSVENNNSSNISNDTNVSSLIDKTSGIEFEENLEHDNSEEDTFDGDDFVDCDDSGSFEIGRTSKINSVKFAKDCEPETSRKLRIMYFKETGGFGVTDVELAEKECTCLDYNI